MDHQPGPFIYDDQRLIFVDDLDRNVLRRKGIRRRSDQIHFDLIIFAEFVRRFSGLTVYEDVFIFNKSLQARAAPALELRSKIRIETNSNMLRINFKEIHVTRCDARNLS